MSCCRPARGSSGTSLSSLSSWRQTSTRFALFKLHACVQQPAPWSTAAEAAAVALTVSYGAMQVIKANDDLTPEHHQFFLYQMLRGLKYVHTGRTTCCGADLPGCVLTPARTPAHRLPNPQLWSSKVAESVCT